MKATGDAKLIALAVLAGAGALWWISRQVNTMGGIGGAAESLAAGAIRAVEGVAVGTVKGIGAAVGVPDTNRTACQADVAAGRWWDASFSCPAGTYINTAAGAAFGSTVIWGAESDDAKALEAARARAQFALTDPRRVDLDPYGGMSPEEYRMYNGSY